MLGSWSEARLLKKRATSQRQRHLMTSGAKARIQAAKPSLVDSFKSFWSPQNLDSLRLLRDSCRVQGSIAQSSRAIITAAQMCCYRRADLVTEQLGHINAAVSQCDAPCMRSRLFRLLRGSSQPHPRKAALPYAPSHLSTAMLQELCASREV